MTRHSNGHKYQILTPSKVKTALRKAGIPQLQAAPLLGVTFEHLNRVLNGHRESQSLLRRTFDLATRETSNA